MSEPTKWIDQRVWEMAIDVWFDQIGMVNDRFDAVGHIALAIQRAIEAERDSIEAECHRMKYTEDQGMDSEMECFNDGLDEAIKAIRNRSNTTTER